jgi:hypothetical protein
MPRSAPSIGRTARTGPLGTAAAALRRTVGRHRWLRRVLVACLAVAAAATTLERVDRIDAARDAWGRTRPVLVAAHDHAPGDPVTVDVRHVPVAMVPPAAVDAADAAGLVARQRIGRGEVVNALDVTSDGPLGLAPRGWLVAAIVESPGSDAAPGERVQLVSEGVVVAAEAIVVGHTSDATLVAVPSDDAPLVPLAAASGTLAVLRVP